MSPATVRRALAVTGVLALAAPVAAQARDMYATDSTGNLHRFDARYPGIVESTVAVTGLPAGASLVGIDVRPATGQIVGVASNSAVYTIDPATGAATPVGSGFSPGLTGTAFGVDVNPVPDALRITSDARQNYRIAFATGNHAAGSPDGALNPGEPQVVASAYTNSDLTTARPATTTLYDIDAATDTLVVQNPPNAGTLVSPLPLGVDVGSVTSFDIAGGIGYMAAIPAGAAGSSLYRVNLGTGAATRLGGIATGRILARMGTPKVQITGLAARQAVGAPLAGNVPPDASIVATTAAPAPGQRATYVAFATDADGSIAGVSWDTDGDGAYGDATGGSARIALGRGVHTIGVRVTDERGAMTTTTTRVAVR